MKPQFIIRFTGKQVKPESFTLEDTLSLLTNLKAALRDFGQTDSVSLVAIKRQSAAYAFASPDVEAGNVGFLGIVNSLAKSDGTVNTRPHRINAYFEKVNRDKQCQTVFYDAGGKPLLTYRKKASPEPVSLTFKEYASVTGKVVRAGGTRTPSAEINCTDGRKITAYGSEAQIKELGQRLYQNVRVGGLMSVNEATGETELSNIAEIYSFEESGIADIFTELREKFGDRLNLGDVVDPVAYQRNIRG